MKKAFKIVLTGGPCAGKSNALVRIIDLLMNRGYTILTIPETATEIMESGIEISPLINPIDFQKIILKKQIQKENFYEETIKYLNNDKFLIICDRGTLDGKAYMAENDFDSLLKDKDINMNEIDLLNRYDAVFHLTSTAIGAEEVYLKEKSNNPCRHEDLQTAQALDKKTLSAWVGHPHLRVIDNSTNFEEKMTRLLNEVCLLLGEPSPMEIERKYLINMPDLENIKNYTKSNILQTYLISSNPLIERRIRQRGLNGNFVYTYTEKEDINGLERIEREKKITEKEYLSLLTEADTSLHQLNKVRCCFIYKNQHFELDIYKFSEDKAILEIELSDKNQQVDLPPFIKVIKDVTSDKLFKNYNLAKELKL